MQQLLSQICNDYIGIQYTKLIITLYVKSHTLQSLVQLSQSSYKHLIQKLKYLINFNIITFEKSNKGVLYSLNADNVLFFQRLVKYYAYVDENCSKEEVKILQYFLQERTSNFQRYIKSMEVKQEQVERNKQIFLGLIKAGYLYEDEKALDLELCERKVEDVAEKPMMVEFDDKQVEEKESPKNTTGKGKSKKSLDKKGKETKDKETIVKGKKKQEIKLVKSDQPIINQKPAEQLNILSKIQNDQTYFSISLNFILDKIKDQLIATRLKSKFNINKPLKYFTQLIKHEKYQAPFDVYNSPPHSPKNNLIRNIQTQLVEQYIYLKYGQNSLLVFKTLLENQYITEKSLLKYTLLELKPLRTSINLLYISGIVKSVEIKIDRINTMVFWIDDEISKREYEGFLTKTCLNLDIIIKRYKAEMEKEENQGVKSTELEQKLCRLEANLLEIDDLLILYKA